MQKLRLGRTIILSIGLFVLIGFLYFGVFHEQWNLGLLLFVVVFLGWGLQRSIGRKESPPHPAVRFLRHTIAAIVSGLAFFFAAIFVLMGLGMSYE
jgi:hypothetical protein